MQYTVHYFQHGWCCPKIAHRWFGLTASDNSFLTTTSFLPPATSSFFFFLTANCKQMAIFITHKAKALHNANAWLKCAAVAGSVLGWLVDINVSWHANAVTPLPLRHQNVLGFFFGGCEVSGVPRSTAGLLHTTYEVFRTEVCDIFNKIRITS